MPVKLVNLKYSVRQMIFLGSLADDEFEALVATIKVIHPCITVQRKHQNSDQKTSIY